MNTDSITIRNACAEDLVSVRRLLSTYFLNMDDVAIGDFVVADINGKTVGCAAAVCRRCPELHSIAVHPNYRNKKIGSRMVATVAGKAPPEWEYLYVRTTAPDFFKRIGFMQLPAAEKMKLWEDCADCERFNTCKQCAMRLPLKRHTEAIC